MYRPADPGADPLEVVSKVVPPAPVTNGVGSGWICGHVRIGGPPALAAWTPHLRQLLSGEPPVGNPVPTSSLPQGARVVEGGGGQEVMAEDGKQEFRMLLSPTRRASANQIVCFLGRLGLLSD